MNVQYECSHCHGIFDAPIKAFDGFIETIRLATKLGVEYKNGRRIVNFNKIPIVNACCPNCFQVFKK